MAVSGRENPCGGGSVTSSLKAESEAASWGREVGVTKGMHRKCVGGGGLGLGGMVLDFS